MSSDAVTVTLPEAQTALCGFRHCRHPLPPPGPRGGRPYEFCPDRVWPGGKSCKQLAAAEQALRDALGETDPPTALRDATDTFADAARQVREPLQALSGVLETVSARMEDELTAAAARADQADRAASDAAQAQHDAEERAQEAERERDAAVAEAQQARTEAADATATAERAVAEADAAGLARARAEATAEAAIDRARRAEDENKVVRAHADELVQRLDELRAQLAERTGERDTAHAALEQHRERSRDLERSLTERLDTTGSHLEQARADLASAAERERELRGRLDDQAEEHRVTERALADAQADVAAHRAEAERLRDRIGTAERERDTVDRVLHRINDAVLAADSDATREDPGALRELVLRELLTRTNPPDDADPGRP
ncbi:hypothetical protein BJF85_15750 [Saccharomonospora sp. CUA-673]|uniref:hypothetical protein n=1 Tax=Saccharomonospora sp. CUA-673 TaxID=1904969 RepID=UPI0009671B07|nr:hypothetical protein [Saccharomonospora sp. CUA-673]OLT46687.1 hypothetical protein BJF85_15750 [Saccharomonospora sp. CUA-673]